MPAVPGRAQAAKAAQKFTRSGRCGQPRSPHRAWLSLARLFPPPGSELYE